MAFLFHRRLAIPLWAFAFVAVALTAPPTATQFPTPPMALFAIAAIGITAIALLMPGPIPWLRTSRAGARVACVYRHPESAGIVVSAGTCVRKHYGPNVTEATDVLDLLRMDDDGGWQMPRPPDVTEPRHGIVTSGARAADAGNTSRATSDHPAAGIAHGGRRFSEAGRPVRQVQENLPHGF